MFSHACELDVEAKGDVDDLEKLVDKAGKIKLCGGKTLAELGSVDKLGGACLDAIQALLPDPETSFEGRLVLLGEQRHEAGDRSLFLLGAAADGEALWRAPLSATEVSITDDGQVRVLAQGEYTLACADSSAQLSIAFVNDYSASMSDGDLKALSAIETSLVGALPDGLEGEVHLFSSDVDLAQPFTSERSELLSAVAVDPEYERQSTALYDGMGQALDSLIQRDRPLKLMVVSTDGQENASTAYSQATLVDTIEQSGVVVVMMGSLLSRPSALRTLSGARGVHAYAPSHQGLRAITSGFVDSLRCVAELRLSAGVTLNAGAVLTVFGQSVEL